ncbi:hypothetical protein MKW92_052853, partial [Papaver armeniacum]
MSDSLYDGVAMPQEHFATTEMTQEQIYSSTTKTVRDAHQIALRGKQVRGGRGTRGQGRGRGRRGAYISSPHTHNVPYMSTPCIPYVGSPYVPYMDSSSGRYTSEPFTITQPSFMEQLL